MADATPSPPAGADLAFAGAARLVALLRAGDVTPRELVELYLGRIERIDPQLNAFRKVLAERALVEADQALARLRAGEERPLLGLPVAIKDEMGVAGEVLANGSNAHGAPEAEDWEIVRRLRSAGAIVIGLTQVPELTIWPFTESAAFGYTRNPWDPQRTPGGSSGGSGAAVAAGLVPLATASDGGGSIRIPAACCGLVGLKPQRDRIPYTPHAEHWHGLSVLGFEARTVEDAALAYEAVTDLPYVAAAAREPGRLRIAMSAKFPTGIVGKVDPQVRRSFEEAGETLRSLGHSVVERDPDYGPSAGLNFVARYLRGIHDDARAMPHPERLEPRTKGMARLGALVGTRGLARARAAEAGDAARIFRIFDDVDVIVHPAIAQLPLEVGRFTGAGALRTLNGISPFTPYSAVWNHLGNPGMVVPVGMSAEGLPLTVQLVGPPDGEERLFSLAAQLERARPWADRRPPLAA
jgi:amidase